MQSPCNDDVVVEVDVECNQHNSIAYAFEDRSDATPTGDGALSVELPHGQFHEEQWHSSKCEHRQVRHEEGPATVLVAEIGKAPDLGSAIVRTRLQPASFAARVVVEDATYVSEIHSKSDD